MVNIGTARLAVQDTTSIELEYGSVSFDTNGNGTFSNSSYQVSFGVGGDLGSTSRF